MLGLICAQLPFGEHAWWRTLMAIFESESGDSTVTQAFHDYRQ
jgi:hypothetical protein